MHRLRILHSMWVGMMVFASFSGAYAQDPCTALQSTLDIHASFSVEFFEGSDDIDGDQLPDILSLRLVEAVTCLNPVSDLYDATLNAYEANLAIFDLEPGAATLLEYRELIATLMLIGVDMQTAVMAGTGGVITGTYVAVECVGSDCVPDAMPGMTVSEGFEVFAIGTRGTNEPYTASGDLDNDTRSNITELDNVYAANNLISHFNSAATSSDLSGGEEQRTSAGGACFIATAAYGTPMATEIDTLRDFRDTRLLTHSLGRAFVDTYYRLSPPIADSVAQYPVVRSGVRMVLAPILWVLQAPIKALVLFAGLAVLLLSARVSRARRYANA